MSHGAQNSQATASVRILLQLEVVRRHAELPQHVFCPFDSLRTNALPYRWHMVAYRQSWWPNWAKSPQYRVAKVFPELSESGRRLFSDFCGEQCIHPTHPIGNGESDVLGVLAHRICAPSC